MERVREQDGAHRLDADPDLEAVDDQGHRGAEEGAGGGREQAEEEGLEQHHQLVWVLEKKQGRRLNVWFDPGEADGKYIAPGTPIVSGPVQPH